MNKSYSLKKNHEIAKLVKVKKSVGTKNFAIYFTESDEVKIAYSINKKYGHAVDRNKAKRIVREIIRKKVLLLPNVHMLIVIKPSSESLTFLEKENEFEYMIRKIIKICKEKTNEKRTK